ncbi:MULTISPECIES: response regulator transcription factor [Cyanophyceae]|uniref:Response regulator transcription factor n=1 Tax=Leptolyngbya subtilissima DQ-A4 TaxID=2933933 RepID=A0ABV0K969_9CYAN|nr:response regulator transcription factor [Nodosilinea sp. FACHB-141]MBD2114241.1 response regulator transcription factor [Nodosilinea sp. FACHB-141]
MKRVLIISPSAITQAGLSAIIAEESAADTDGSANRWQVVGAAAQPLSREWAADCALVSWPMVGDGLSDLDPFNNLAMPVVALIDAWSDVALLELLQGRVGLLPGQASGAEIVAALDAAVAGLVAVHPSFLDSLLASTESLQTTAPPHQTEALTPREVEVLTMLAEGLSNKAIARRLHLSEHTIKYHTSAIFAKLNVSSRTEAAIAGARAGFILL